MLPPHDYITTQLSHRALGKKYGLSEDAIRKRARTDSWVRNNRYANSTQQQHLKPAGINVPPLTQFNTQLIQKYEINRARESHEPNEYWLNHMQQRFVYEYLKDLNQSAAYRRTWYNCAPGSLCAAASRLYRNVKVNRAVQSAMKDRLASGRIRADDVMRWLWNIVIADPNEPIQYRRVNCRKCWSDIARDPTDDPNPDCGFYFGEGIGEIYHSDTREISVEATSLYAGGHSG